LGVSLSTCVREVKHSLVKYAAAGDEENAAVSRSLDTIQNLEEERLFFLLKN